MFPNIKGKVGGVTVIDLSFDIEELLDVFDLDFERPILFFCGLVSEVEGAAVFVRFLFFEIGSDAPASYKFNNNNIC
jgi:hypothetical protein